MRRLLALLILAAAPALAADRHVFLDTDADGQLNACPNPAHNPRAIAGNTDELTRCVCTGGGCSNSALNNRVTTGANAPRTDWTLDPILDATCTGAGGSIDPVNNGDTVEVDGESAAEPIYGHPQACVWNMAGPATGGPDSCEIHAGTYQKAGAQAGTALVEDFGGGTSYVACERTECWKAMFAALGNGPNMGTKPGSGYGTEGNPGYVRGAVMAGSTDTWDSDNDKIPDCNGNTGTPACYGQCAGGSEPDMICIVDGDCNGGGTCDHTIYSGEPTSYYVIFDGNVDGDGTKWESTSCTDYKTCTGDAFYAMLVGCGHSNINAYLCPSSVTTGQHRVFIDDDANGVFEDADELGPGGESSPNWKASFLTVKDITYRHFNGGTYPCTAGGSRDYLGHFAYVGGNATVVTEVTTVDHMFWYDTFYSRFCRDEHYTAIWGDNENHYSTKPDVMSNSFIISGNRFVINDDCGEYGECGGSKTFIGNRVVFPPFKPDGTAFQEGQIGESSQGEFQTFLRNKSMDSVMAASQPKVFRFTNNEFIVQKTNVSTGGNEYGLMYMECFGICWHASDVSACTAVNTPYACCTGICDGGSSPGSSCTYGGAPCPGGGVCGTCEAFQGPGQGQIWFNGNLVRFQGSGTPTWSSWSLPYCSGQGNCEFCSVNGPYATTDQKWRYYNFNNTWDVQLLNVCSGGSNAGTPCPTGTECQGGGTCPQNTSTSTLEYLCNGVGTLYTSKNNAIFGGTAFNTEVALTERQAYCAGGSNPGTTCVIGGTACPGGGTCTGASVASTTSGSTAVVSGGATRSNWWTGHTKNSHVHAGLSNYVPTASGTAVLHENTRVNVGACDPDGDGVAGVNYYGTGNVTTWTDIAGNTVSCPTINSPLSYGAIQPNSDGAPTQTCGNGSREGAEVCDGGDLNGQSCSTQGFIPGGTLTCNGGCTDFVTTNCLPDTDRHVLLNQSGGGTQLDDCPNPTHNVIGTSNTNELQYCAGGTSKTKIIGTVSGTVTSGTCTAGGGVVTAVTSGVMADIDRDGKAEAIYGHPQACVWNMNKSGSCEIHAGTYTTAGAQCDEDCGDQGFLEGTADICDKFDCFTGSVVALGDGPNLDGTGYGTAGSPGYLRGAVMMGSTDSWDPNGDKDPSDGTYPAILSGDRDADGVFDRTTCTGNACSGDSFYGVIIGCGIYADGFCRPTPSAGSNYIKIDSNADGTFDQNVGVFTASSKEVHYLQIKDLEFTRYNGGNGCTAGTCALEGTRPRPGMIDLNGDGVATNGLVVDHIYLHDNDYTLGIDNLSCDNVSNEGFTENHWSAFNDHSNDGCTTPTYIQNSFLVQNNARLLNNDCDETTPCGCDIYFHDNRVLIDVDASKAGVTYTRNTTGTCAIGGGACGDADDCTSGGACICGTPGTPATHSTVFAYLKSIGANPSQHRLWNNEFIIKSMGTSRGYFMDLQGFGTGGLGTNGTLWMYGNLFRNDPAMTLGMSRLWQGFCGGQSTTWRWYDLNNTYDMNTGMDPICGAGGGDRLVQKNNAYFRLTNTAASSATTMIRLNNASSTVTGDRVVWFNPGNFTAGNPGTHGGLANYVPRVGGPLDNISTNNACDPDEDGNPGMDYNGDNIQDTSWINIAGQTVSCTSIGAAMDIGAIANTGAAPTGGTKIKGVRSKGIKIR